MAIRSARGSEWLSGPLAVASGYPVRLRPARQLTSGVFSFQFAIGYRRRFSVCHRLPPTVLSLPSATADGSLPSATAGGSQFAIGYRRRFSVCHRLPPTVLISSQFFFISSRRRLIICGPKESVFKSDPVAKVFDIFLNVSSAFCEYPNHQISGVNVNRLTCRC